MKILIKYISKLFIGPFLIGLGGFIVFVSVEILYQLSSIIVRHRVGVSKLLLLVYYYLPYFTSMGIPVGVLLAIFWIVTELSSRRELMALQVHGISLKNLILPFMLISLFLSVAAFFLNDSIVPVYQEKAEMVLAKYIYKRAGVEAFIVENTLAKYENQYIYIRKYDEKRGIIKGVVLFRYDENGEEIITADEVVKEGTSWYLMNGRYYRVDEDGFLRFDSGFKKLKLDIGEDLETFLRVKKPRTMTGKELREKIKTLKKLGVNPSSWLVELHTRYSTALAPLIIVLVGLSLSLTFNLKSKSWGVILTFILIVLYQGSGAWLSAMGKERLIDPVLSAWIPDISFSLVGLVFFLILGTKFEYKLREIFGRIFFLLILIIPSLYFSEDILVTCDGSMFESEIATFTGNVKMFYREVELSASTAVAFFDRGNLIRLEALNAKLIDKQGELHADFMVFYPDSSLTELYVVSGYVATERGKIDLSSDRLYRMDRWIVLRDGVIIKLGDIEAVGDFFKILSRNGEIQKVLSPFPTIARGETEDGKYEILASRFEADPQSSKVVLEDFRGKITFTQNKKEYELYDYGREAVVTDKGVEISGGYITTCSLKNPHYSIAASRIVYRYGAHITAEHAVLIVLGIPVFYFPYFFTTVSQDVGFQLGFSLSRASVVSSFTFTHRYSKTGEMSLSRTTGGYGNTYSLKISDDINGYKISADYGFNEKDLEVSDQSAKLKISLPFPTKPTLMYEDLKDHSKLVYSLSGSAKFGKGKLNYLVSRTRSGNSTSYLLPSIKLSNLSLDIFDGKLVLKSIFHKSALSFSTGTVLENLEGLRSDGKITATYGKTLSKDLGSSLKLSLYSDYSFTGASPTSYSGRANANFVVFSKKLKYSFIEFTPKETLGFGISLSKDGKTSLTLSENLSMKSGASLGPFSVSADYSRSNSFTGEWGEALESSKKAHVLKISSAMKIDLIGTKFGVSTSYDFLKEGGTFSKPVLTTESSFKVAGVDLTLKTGSIYDYENELFEKTDLNFGISKKLGDWNISGSLKTTYTYTEDRLEKLDFSFAQNYKGKKFANTMTISYDPNSDSPLSDLVDSFSFKNMDVLYFKKLNLSGQIRLGLDQGIDLKSLKAKGSFQVGKSKNSISLNYRASNPDSASLSLSYSLSSFDPQIKIGLTGGMINGSWNFNKISLDLRKDLHCWSMTLSGVFRFSEGDLRIEKLLMKFQLKEFPDKFFSYSAKDETFDINLF